MRSVAQHYAEHLAPVYTWMAGGAEAAFSRGAAELASLGLAQGTGLTAVDLGAGFGMHAIPLARCGYSVLALDSSAILLSAMRERIGSLAVRTVEADLSDFPRHLTDQPDLILCMGDTLTHLPDRESVEQLVGLAARSLKTGGRFILSFRDYSMPLFDEKRFIPVRSDDQRIQTCFLEYFEEHVLVHDLLQERSGAGWTLAVSAYRKLRLSPDWVVRVLTEAGFSIRREPGLAGMVRLDATVV
jgi:SAM-dependent methyltransferase